MTFDNQTPQETTFHQRSDTPRRTILRISLAIAWMTALGFDSFVLSQNGILWYLGHGGFVFFTLLLSFIITQNTKTISSRAFHLGIFFLLAAIAVWLATFPKAILAPVLLTIWASFLPFLFSTRTLFFVWAMVNGIFIVSLLTLKPGMQHLVSGISFIGFQLFAIATTSAMLNAEQKRNELERAHNELRSAQALLNETTKNEERLRIARDLHDSIGHRLTGLGLTLEHAKHKPPSDTEQFYSKLRNDVSLTLNELRTIVNETRLQSTTNISQILHHLASAIPNITLKCDSEISLTHTVLSQQLIYCLQEGMSNAIRHGHANHFTVTYETSPEHRILLRNNGEPLTGFDHGNGLTGMQERLLPFGGRAELNSEKSGTTLSLTFQPPHHQ